MPHYFQNLEDYKSLYENTTNPVCQSLNSCSKSDRPVLCTDIDQYYNSQAEAQDDRNDHVNLRYDGQKISYQFYHIGGEQLSYQHDCSTIFNDEPLEFDCEGEASQATIWAQ